MNDSLLDRCAAAYEDAILSQYSHQQAIAAVLEHLAAEITVMVGRAPNLTPHQLITILRLEADRDEEPDETWDSHPSLTAEERNPTLR